MDELTKIAESKYGIFGLLLVVLVPALWKIFAEIGKLRQQMVNQQSLGLLAKRNLAYANLWSNMAPTAIYTTSTFSNSDSTKYSEALSKWYFSKNGGLFMTQRSRDFYFSLQKLLKAISSKEWKCKVRPENTTEIFGTLLKMLPDLIEVKGEQFKRGIITNNISEPEKIDSEIWLAGCQEISNILLVQIDENSSEAGNNIYAAVKQVTSILRTILTKDISSRFSIDSLE